MKFAVGDKVYLLGNPGQRGVVTAVGAKLGALQRYMVFWGQPWGESWALEGEISRTPEEHDLKNLLIQGHLGGAREFKRQITQYRMRKRSPLRNQLYAFNASRTRFYPYQFKPLIKFLSSPHHRMLIADEVGLGKTIEAGLILVEMKARQKLRSVVIVCPASLREKWRIELKQRFDERFEICNAQRFIKCIEEQLADPDSFELRAIISYETLRSERTNETLKNLQPSFDLVIMDEAHHMRNVLTATHKAGAMLAEASRGVGALLLLTATPVHLGNKNLWALLKLLDGERFESSHVTERLLQANAPIVRAELYASHQPPNFGAIRECLNDEDAQLWTENNPLKDSVLLALETCERSELSQEERREALVRVRRDLADLNLVGHLFTRTRRRHVQVNHAQRRAFARMITMHPLEKAFYERVSRFIVERAIQQGYSGGVLHWLLHVPQRQMSSCIMAMVKHYLTNPKGTGIDDQDEDDKSVADTQLQDELRREVQLAAQQLYSAGIDSKFEAFRETLMQVWQSDPQSKVVVFAFFKGTLRYLEKKLLESGIDCVLLSGDVNPDIRPALIEKFRNDSKTKILLSSRVGSEGLDFQFSHVMVNYDLPWNPMEVEQRIGRLDRIGQQAEAILIHNLWMVGTIETTILFRLYDRIKIFESSIGALEPILGEVLSELERDAFSAHLTAGQRERRAEEVANALVERRMQLEKLEDAAAQLLGTGVYFDEELRKVQTYRRYITPAQLRDYLIDFLTQFCPDSSLVAGRDPLIETLQLGDTFRRLAAEYRMLEELSPVLRDSVKVTFDSETAFQDNHLLFLSAVHPLMNLVMKVLERHPHMIVPAHRVRLATSLIPPGDYIYVVTQVNIQSARPFTELHISLVGEDGDVACSENDAEQLLGEMMEHGEEVDGPLSGQYSGRVEIAHEIALGRLLERLARLKEELQRENELFLARQRLSIDTFYRRQIDDIERRIQNQANEKINRMLKSQKRNRQREHLQRLDEIESRQQVSITFEDVATGLLVVSR